MGVSGRGWAWVRGIGVQYTAYYSSLPWRRSGPQTRPTMWRSAAVVILLFSSFSSLSAKSPIHIEYPASLFTRPNWRDTRPYFSSTLTKNNGYLAVSRAQDKEDVWAYENWFYGMANGTILESGALDGMKISTSFMFEKFASWFAIHVEAMPQNFNKLKQLRSDSINVHAALCKEAQLLHLTRTPGDVPTNGFVEFMTPAFLEKWHSRIYANPELIKTLPTTLCIPVSHLLSELGIHHIDLWILDVEGAELPILEGMDFKKVTVSTIVMECDQGSVKVDEAKQNILLQNGFQCQLVRLLYSISPVYLPHNVVDTSD